jgi:hypothetical protein
MYKERKRKYRIPKKKENEENWLLSRIRREKCRNQGGELIKRIPSHSPLNLNRSKTLQLNEKFKVSDCFNT